MGSSFFLKDIEGDGYYLWFCFVLDLYHKVSKEELQCAVVGGPSVIGMFQGVGFEATSLHEVIGKKACYLLRGMVRGPIGIQFALCCCLGMGNECSEMTNPVLSVRF